MTKKQLELLVENITEAIKHDLSYSKEKRANTERDMKDIYIGMQTECEILLTHIENAKKIIASR